MTTVAELRFALERFDDDTEVRLMSQSSWPFEYSIEGTWDVAPNPDACRECGHTEGDHIHSEEAIDSRAPEWQHAHEFEPYESFTPEGGLTECVYIVEGTQLGYGTKTAWTDVEPT